MGAHRFVLTYFVLAVVCTLATACGMGPTPGSQAEATVELTPVPTAPLTITTQPPPTTPELAPRRGPLELTILFTTDIEGFTEPCG